MDLFKCTGTGRIEKEPLCVLNRKQNPYGSKITLNSISDRVGKMISGNMQEFYSGN